MLSFNVHITLSVTHNFKFIFYLLIFIHDCDSRIFLNALLSAFLQEAEINNLILNFKVDTYIVAKIEPPGSLCIFVW